MLLINPYLFQLPFFLKVNTLPTSSTPVWTKERALKAKGPWVLQFLMVKLRFCLCMRVREKERETSKQRWGRWDSELKSQLEYFRLIAANLGRTSWFLIQVHVIGLTAALVQVSRVLEKCACLWLWPVYLFISWRGLFYVILSHHWVLKYKLWICIIRLKQHNFCEKKKTEN